MPELMEQDWNGQASEACGIDKQGQEWVGQYRLVYEYIGQDRDRSASIGHNRPEQDRMGMDIPG